MYPAPDKVMHMAKNETLDALRLPELQARFKEVVGEASKSPNRKFLIRRIEEALAKRAEPKPRGRFKELSVEELREKYVEVVGRPSGSSSKPYVEAASMGSRAASGRCSPSGITEDDSTYSSTDRAPNRLEVPAPGSLYVDERHVSARSESERA